MDEGLIKEVSAEDKFGTPKQLREYIFFPHLHFQDISAIRLVSFMLDNVPYARYSHVIPVHFSVSLKLYFN
jgi:hypothetical protein